MDPDKVNGLVIMNNSNYGNGLNLRIANSTAKIYPWPAFNISEPRKTITLSSQALKGYEGTFKNGQDSIRLLYRQGKLLFSSNYSFYSPLRRPSPFSAYLSSYV
jgi:hypothetical protein